MDLIIDPARFQRTLRLAARLVAARSALPILQAVLLEATPEGLSVRAADGEGGLLAWLPATVATPGRAAVPARLLAEYVAQLPPEPLRLALDPAGRRLSLTCAHCRASLVTLPAEDFPTFPAEDERTAREIDAGRLQAALHRVAFAASRDASRAVLTAVQLDFGSSGLTLAAADGFRLALAHLPGVDTEPGQVLVPARLLSEWSRLLSGAPTARLVLGQEARGLYLAVGTVRLFTRLVEGRYPDLSQILPREWRTRVAVETAALRQAVSLAGLFGAEGEVRPVVLQAAPGRLCLTAQGEETGEAHSELPASVDGESQSVALDPRLLTEVLEVASGSSLEIHWIHAQTPVVLREVDRPDLWMVMPLHLPTLLG